MRMMRSSLAIAALVVGILGCADSANAEPVFSRALSAPEPPQSPRARAAAMRVCYEQLLRRGSFEAGKVRLQLDVDDDGRVTHADVKTEALGDATFLQCVLDRALTWRLPLPERMPQVTYALIFQPGL